MQKVSNIHTLLTILRRYDTEQYLSTPAYRKSIFSVASVRRGKVQPVVILQLMCSGALHARQMAELLYANLL